MKIDFGHGSSAQTEKSSWEMVYPWPPFHRTYDNEPGLLIHLSAQDVGDIVSTLRKALSGVSAAVANALGAFAVVVPAIVSHLVKNDDGSITVRIAPHGFQVGNLPAADPNVWVNGAWKPVKAALWQLDDTSLAARSLSATGATQLPPPHTGSQGWLVSAKEIVMTATKQLGPSGGGGGHPFSDDALPPSSRVVEVRIRHGKYIDAVQIIHETSVGAVHPMPMHGGDGGKLDVFQLDADEYITGISGGYGKKVDSLRLHTNRQESILYGGSGPNSYRYDVEASTEVVGFFGRCGDLIDAIGIIIRQRAKDRT